MKNNIATFSKKEIATEQLKTAIWLFLKKNNLSSVITLASASSNILKQLVINEGKEPFIDYACRVHEAQKGKKPPRKKYGYFIDNFLGVIAHKHMSKDCDLYTELDLHQSAVDSLIRAVADYVTLYGQDEKFIKQFLSWTSRHMDSDKLMEAYQNAPKKLKRE